MGRACAGWKGRKVKSACVCRMHLFAIGRMSNDWHCGGGNIQRWHVGRKEVACGAGVQDSPLFDGFGIGADWFEE